MISERDIIYITKKQASVAVVTLAIFCLLIFMLGYFWGKQSVLDGFGQRVTQESITDQADYASMLQSVVERPQQDPVQIESNQASSDNHEFLLEEKTIDDECLKKNQQDADLIKSSAKGEKKERIENKSSVKKKYSAVLVGFGTKGAATSFVNKLKSRGIQTQIRTRVSKSSSGKTKKMWYQVITEPYNSREDLNEALVKIKKIERLKDSDIKII